MIRACLLPVACAALLLASSARAEGPSEGEKKAAAQALFDDARALTSAGKFPGACPKFAESQRLNPSIGTKFYLADCLEHTGKLASAWTYYLEVADAARALGQKDREKFADERAEALRPRLSNLAIKVSDAVRRGVPGLTLRRDRTLVGEAQWNAAIPVDPGRHVVDVTGKDRQPAHFEIDVLQEGEIALEVPLLSPLSQPTEPPKPPEPPPPPPPPPPAQKIAGFTIGGAGLVVAVSLGAYFTSAALDKKSQSNQAGHCDAADTCDATGLSLRSQGLSAATAATASVIAGGLAVVGGIVLVATAPRRAPGRPRRRPRSRSRRAPLEVVMSPRAGRGLIAPVALLSMAAGCQLLIGLDGGTPRDGGAGGGATGGATTSASSTSSSTSPSSTSATSTSATTSTSSSATTSGTTSTSSTSTTSTTTTGTTTTTTTTTPSPGVLLLAGSATGSVMGGTFAESWTTTTIAGAMTADVPALVVVPATGQGVGLVHVATSNLLDYTIYDGSTWSSFTQLHADATLGPPALVGSGSTAQLVYGGTNYNFYYESWSGSAWSASTPAIVPLGDAGSLCGPSAPSIALAGANLSMVFVNGICSGTTNALYDSDLSGGSWQAATTTATTPSDTAAQHPAVTAPSSGPELVVAFIAKGTSQMYTSSRTNGTWSTPVVLTNGLTNDPVALAPVAGGGGMTAMMAYRGTDLKLYTSFFDGTSWATPSAAFSPTNVTVNAAPSVAKGIGGMEAEMGYVDGSGAVWHTRYNGTAWSTAVQVGTGTGFASVAIAGGP